MQTRIAVVTGGNKGIGLEICRQLAQQGVNVVLTARDEARGLRAVERLQGERLNVIFHPLDVTSDASVQALCDYMTGTHGRCDALVNNAGISLRGSGRSVLTTALSDFETTLATNFYGPLRLTQALVGLMQKNGYGRIVNLSSGLGQLAEMDDGWAAYRVSKTALNALTRMVAQAVAGENIKVNSACPGWVRTDMGGGEAPRSVEEGARTPVWLATLPDDGPSGGFFRDRGSIPW
jgi:NAD(P)-dependent dehydrogenase (short-subunit alcohol dehydrogenase family)